ncbi:MAG: hypothetical protein WDN28_33570 [Chthoniobacter sp.]
MPFREADFQAYGRAGSSTVRGHASSVTNDGYPVTANQYMTVYLLPQTAYTKEIVDREYRGGKPLEDPPARSAPYIRKVRTDDHGNFVFSSVPAGDYYVSCLMLSEIPTTVTVGDDPNVASTSTNMQWIYTSIHAANAATVDVNSWQRGEWH